MAKNLLLVAIATFIQCGFTTDINQFIINSYQMKPMHIDEDDYTTMGNKKEKTEKKQKMGRDVSLDLGGKGLDYVISGVNENNFGLSAKATA